MKLPFAGPGFALLLALAALTQGCAGDYSETQALSTGVGGAGGGSAGAGGSANWGGAGGSKTTTGTDGQADTPISRAGGQNPSTDDPATPQPFELPECLSAQQKVAYFYSSDDSNSMASPVIARELLAAGQEPVAGRIRTHEFLNYYNVLYDLPEPAGEVPGIFTEMQAIEPSPETGVPRFRLQVGVQAFTVPRVPLVLTFVVDASGSLVGQGIARERAVLQAIAHQLQKDDIVNIVKWATDENVLLEKYVATGNEADETALAAAITKLAPGGGSDLHSGLVKGYELAGKHFAPEKLNRVVLISDGGANLGVVDRTIIAEAAAQGNDEGVYLVGIGVGPAQGYSDELMDLVTDAGRGAYLYLDGTAEAEAVMQQRFEEIMNVAARNVRVQIDLPAYLDIEHFYGEKHSEDAALIDPQNLAPGDSMIFNQILDVNDPMAACGLDTVKVLVRWETPLTHEPRELAAAEPTLLELLGEAPSPQLLKANAVIAYAEALKDGGAVALAAALSEVDAAAKSTGDADLQDIAALLKLHPKLKQ